MSEINSIANGTFTIGSTSALSFEAGPGIKIDEPSAGTVRIGNDETVLWSGAYSTTTTSITLSESLSNFEKVKILWQHNNDTTPYRIWLEYTPDTKQFFCTLGRADNTSGRVLFEAWWTNSITSLSKVFCRWNYMTNGSDSSNWSDANELVPIKIVGINRKEV